MKHSARSQSVTRSRSLHFHRSTFAATLRFRCTLPLDSFPSPAPTTSDRSSTRSSREATYEAIPLSNNVVHHSLDCEQRKSMRRRSARVKLSATSSYKVRNLGDIGDAVCAKTGLRSIKSEARFTLDFVIASTNRCVRYAQERATFHRHLPHIAMERASTFEKPVGGCGSTVPQLA